MVTQLFITNWILLLATVMFDVHFLSNALERMKYVGTGFGYWALASLVAIPVWIVYLIWSI